MIAPPKLFALGLQHVLVMYAGAIAVPLIIGRALKLPPETVALLINADLLACGIVTIIQSLGLGPVGIRLPVMMGVTFAAVGPMLAIANDPSIVGVVPPGATQAAIDAANGTQRLLTIFGSAIAAGIFAIMVAPLLSFLLPLFPPIVTGSIILMIGISLMRVGVNWAAGAAVPTLPGYGDVFNIGVAALVMAIILLITRFVKGFFGNIAVLMGIVVGCLLCYFVWGTMSLNKVHEAPMFALIYPFQFGMPIFDLKHIITMCIVMIVVLIESAGMFLALSDMTGKKIGQRDMTRGLMADGVGTTIGGIMNTFPYTSFSQNVGLVGVTGVRSRWVTVMGGVIMVVMGLIPKLGALAESIPLYVLGGAGIVMFGMVAATGIRILADVDYKTNRNNLFIVALSVGFGLIPLVAPTFFNKLTALVPSLGPILHSGIILTAIVSVALNLFFNGLQSREEAAAAAARTTHGSE
ncbi:MAG TPA: nucleobase:cation symporter-2 family protein [Hyphomicrobiaceae bacterium]|nr:nucleobase:cation symporter-2 family protein [Hyphomicrobiaceae bacterium]